MSEQITGKKTEKLCSCGKHLVYIGSVSNGLHIHTSGGRRVTMWAVNPEIYLKKQFENFKKIAKLPDRTCPEGEDLYWKEEKAFLEFLDEQNIEWRLQEFEGDKLIYNVSNHEDLKEKALAKFSP